MLKSVTFISMALTTFVLVLVAGVVYTYQSSLTHPSTSDIQTSSSLNTVSLALTTPTQDATANSVIPPQEAASIAGKFSNRTDLYSIEITDFNGSPTYKVTFSSGDILYVAMNGQVLGSAPASQVVVASPSTTPTPPIIYKLPIKKRASGGGGGGSGGGSGGSDGGGGDGGGGGGDN